VQTAKLNLQKIWKRLKGFFVLTPPRDAISLGIFLSPQTAQQYDFNRLKSRRSEKSYAETERLNAPFVLKKKLQWIINMLLQKSV
jgi:hypothetical protein